MSVLVNRVRAARQSARVLATLKKEDRNLALEQVKVLLGQYKEDIFKANEADLAKAREEDLALPLLSRLAFDEKTLNTSLDGIDSLLALEDPVGKIGLATKLDEGLELYRVSCPLGVVGVIFESRPDALVQIACLAIKSGNAVLLKGGSEAKHTNEILAKVLAKATADLLPDAWLTLLEDRAAVNEILSLDQDIDLLIPRGSNEFVRYIMDNTRIPVLGHADGICHTYIAKDAPLDLARTVVLDAKTQYTAVCNATETLLIDKAWPKEYRKAVLDVLREKDVELSADEELALDFGLAKQDNWALEYLDLGLSVKLVDGIDDAISHINTYGSGHTDAILTMENALAEQFMNEVDSANVFWNCSTRFSDGFRYGFGAEVGVSTSKIHARGPVGLYGLMTYKYKLYGSGQIVGDYSSGAKVFLHDKIDL